MTKCNYYWNSTTNDYDYRCKIVDECCTGCGFVGAFTIDGECFHQKSVTSYGPYSYTFTESKESIEKDPNADDSYVSPNRDGKYQLWRSVGDSREKCVSRGDISDFDSLVDINKRGWDCGDYSGPGNRNPSVSCGCWIDESLSGGEISGIVIGVLAFLAIVILAVLKKKGMGPSCGSIKKLFTGCCNGRKSNKESLPVVAVPINNMGEVWSSVKVVEVPPPLPRRPGVPPPLPPRNPVNTLTPANPV